MTLRRWALAALLVAGATDARAAEPLPIFDAHLHYSRPAWSLIEAGAALRRLAEAGVTGALVSSTPDDGSIALHRAAPDRILPILRPYRDGVGSGNWHDDGATPAYVEDRLRLGVHKGIGEVHLFDAAAAKTPVTRRLARLAVEREMFFHVHSDDAPVRALFEIEPGITVLWAHAGMVSPPAVVGEMLARYPRLWTEVSFRAGDIAPGGTLDPAWREVLIRHSDRILIGSDTYVNGRWESYVELIAAHRRWLARLPDDVARRIAHGNARRLFGGG